MAKKSSKFNSYSPEFKLEVVNAYLSGQHGGLTRVTNEFGLKSTSQLRQWLKKYQEMGVDGLKQDNRGAHFKGKSKVVHLEELSLEDQILHLKMENDILKKYNTLLEKMNLGELLSIKS